jgi:hypothetical protein
MSRRLMLGKGTGNREVSRPVILALRGDRNGAEREATPEEGARGGTLFPRGSDPKGRDA